MKMKKLTVAVALFILFGLMFGCSASGPPTRGTVSDGVYTNDYFGLSFTIPDGWKALTDAESSEQFGVTMKTNEEIATKENTGFNDVVLVNPSQEKDYMIIYYTIQYEKGLTDDQIRNRIKTKSSDIEFGDVGYFTAGDIKFAKMSASDGTIDHYCCWGTNIVGNLRPVIYIKLAIGESINDILANFSQISE